MTETAAKLKLFFSQFGLSAYEVGSVPLGLDLPYITYPLTEPSWDYMGSLYCQIWYPKNRFPELLAKADEVLEAVGNGVKITMPDGYLMLYLASQQAQIMSDLHTQSAYISLLTKSYHLPGV